MDVTKFGGSPQVGDILITKRDTIGDTGQDLVPCDGARVNLALYPEVMDADGFTTSIALQKDTSIVAPSSGFRGSYKLGDFIVLGRALASNAMAYSRDGGKTWSYAHVSNTGLRYATTSRDMQYGYIGGEAGKIAIFNPSANPITLTSKTLAGDTSHNHGIHCDPTGQYAVAQQHATNTIHISTDYGSTWASKALSCYGIAFTDDRSICLAGGKNGEIFRSTDFYDTWATQAGVIGGAMIALDISANGEIAIVGDNTGVCKISRDGALTWQTITTPISVAYWYGAACDDTGKFIAFGAATGEVIASTDYGNTWQQLTGGTHTDVAYLDMDRTTGDIIVGGGDGGVSLWRVKNGHYYTPDMSSDSRDFKIVVESAK